MNFKNLFQQSLRNPNAVIPFIMSLPKYVRLYGRLLQDSRVPLAPKIVFIAGFIYAISPIDLVPDFLVPVLGWIDDIIILVAAARYFIRACPPEIVAEHVAAIQEKR
jgi:uncharacterized membrane protein YkvA (DUF1232 family)